MPIGSIVVYNVGDLILSTVSSSGNTFQENKIAAATSSIILFNSNGLISSQSLSSTTVGTASSATTASYLVQANSYELTNLTASNVSASGYISASSIMNTGTLRVLGNSVLTTITSSNISASGNISASMLVGNHTGSTFGTSSWAQTASLVSSAGNAFVQNGNSFGTTATIGTNDANNLVFRTNGSNQMTINSGGKFGIGTTVNSANKITLVENHLGTLGSSSLLITTNMAQNSSSATSANDVGIYNIYNVNTFTGSTVLQNMAMLNQIVINGSGSYSGSYRALQNSILISNTSSLDSAGTFQNTFCTNQISANVPNFSISNWIAGTQVFVDSGANITGSVTNLYGHWVQTPFVSGVGGVTVNNAYGIYISRQKQTNVVTNGWGIYQSDTNDLNIFAGKTRFGGTATPVNVLDVSGNISASSITASLLGTSSWSTNSLTASNLVPANSYIVNNLTASNNISASGFIIASSFTGSFSGSIGNAVSSSYALSASFAPTNTNITASWATNARTASSLITNNNYIINALTASGPIIYDNSVLLDYSSSTMPTTISVVIQNSTGSYNAAFFDYAIFSSSNSRAGTIVSAWNSGSIVYNEVCTTDIGNTSQITMSVVLNVGTVQLVASGSVTNWNIKSAARYI